MKRLISAALFVTAFAWGVPAFSDSIDSNTKLLVQSNNTGTPTTFLDTSAGAKTVTTVGGAVQIPHKINRTAIFTTNGGADFIQFPDHADWDIGTGDFSLNFFIMFRSLGNVHLFSFDDGPFTLDYINTGPTLRLQLANSVVKNESWSPSINTWYHVVVDRNGTNLRMFVNGTELGTATTAGGSIATSTGAYVGCASGASACADAWFKEVRFSNVSRYTANFTPPTDAYTSDSNTKILLHGNTNASYPLSPWIKVDGTGDYLTIPDAAWQDFGTGDFSIEANVRWNSVGTSTVAEIGNAGSVGAKIVYSASTLQFVVNGSAIITPSFAPVANRNYHIAGVRASGTVYLFADGVLLGSGANSSNITGLTNGVRIANDQSSQLINGWIRSIRISNNARYTAAFTPPTTSFTSDANTMFLLNGSDANGTTSFTDASSNAATITTNGDTKIDFQEDWRSTIITDSGNTGHKPYAPVTSRAKVDFVSVFGNGSGLLDGSGDYLTLADSSDWQLGGGTGNFTYDLWVRPSDFSNTQEFLAQGNDSSTYMDFRLASATELRFGADTTIFSYGAPLSGNPQMVANTWYHVALIRGWASGANTYAITVNGRAIVTGTDSDTYPNYSGGLGIGNLYYGTTDQGAPYYFKGYMDNNRISDIARWTATFDPSDSEFSSGRKRSPVFF